MQKIKPQKLEKGQTIGLLSVSGYVAEPKRTEYSKKYFEKNGFNVKISNTTYEKFRYHSGTDESRVNALHDFFEDDDIDAIVCTRGGYGVIRILDKINYNLIKNHPKILCGYSDITALLLRIQKETGLICFHGAMANGDFGKSPINPYTEKSFFNTLTSGENLVFQGTGSINPGLAEGILWGGNLATITTMIGTDFVPDENLILFIEDVNEPAYKADRMLIQIFNNKDLNKRIKGIAVGKFTGIDREEYFNEMLKETGIAKNIPVSAGYKISHEKEKDTLPIGIKCTLDGINNIIQINEKIFCN